MSERVTTALIDIFAKIFPAIEPLTPRLFSLFLTRYLRRWKANGSILSYKARVKRLGKQHYLATVDIEVTRKQTEQALKRLLEEATGRR
jgi:hypothetical protein